MPNRPPVEFGSAWRCVGELRRFGNLLPLWTPDRDLTGYGLCYSRLRAPLVAAGYSWTDTGDGRLVPCFWDTGVILDPPALQALVDATLAEDAAARAEKERQEREDRQRDIAQTMRLAAPIRAELQALIAERPWALGRALTEARDLATSEAWTAWGLRCAERYLSNASANIERAEQRLSRPALVAWYALASDPDVRQAALEACQALSALDEDWAAERNSRGWSQSTTWTGHVLSERENLDHGQATHALEILHQHRRQLSDDLNIRIFGAVPAGRRRPAPALGL